MSNCRAGWRSGSESAATKQRISLNSEWNMPTIPRWREAAVRGAVIVTKDEDFSVIVRARIKPQVVWVRVGNCSNVKLLARMAETWSSLMSELEAGIALIEIR